MEQYLDDCFHLTVSYRTAPSYMHNAVWVGTAFVFWEDKDKTWGGPTFPQGRTNMHPTGEMAQYLIDEVERVLAENAY